MRNRFILSLFICFSCFLKAQSQNLDLRLLQSINGPASGADATWKHISGSVYVTAAATPASMLIVALSTHNKELTVEAFETGAAIVISAGLDNTIKNITKRDRPYLTYPTLITGKETDGGYSFPSIHTSVAFATATSLSLSFPKWYVIAPSFAYASTVGYSRLYLGVHYPSDVLGGALIGAGSTFLTWKLQKLLNKKYHYH